MTRRSHISSHELQLNVQQNMASSDPPDIPNPPEQRPVPTLDELVEFLRTFACKYGFNISKRKGGRLRTRDGEEIMTSYVLFCPWESHNSNGGESSCKWRGPLWRWPYSYSSASPPPHLEGYLEQGVYDVTPKHCVHSQGTPLPRDVALGGGIAV